ncbi:hypothetical protein MIR68_002680 [Amoeboaphelidium protococcarum]|nr:hypothetical protein MIR68_002680 [Amoeboaphelidium protococcarum]
MSKQNQRYLTPHAQSLMDIFENQPADGRRSSEQSQSRRPSGQNQVSIELDVVDSISEANESEQGDQITEESQNQQKKLPSSKLNLFDSADYDYNDTVKSNLALYGSNYATHYLTARSWDPSSLLRQIEVEPGESSQDPTRRMRMLIGCSGTLVGVIIPNLQVMVGILLFIRLPFIIGYSGVTHTLFIILMSMILVLLTTMSMSAICTNGVVSNGGLYYLISRSLGKDIGITSGFLLYLATQIGAAVYVLGCVEVLSYLVPQISVDRWQDSRLYGSILLIIISLFQLMLQKVQRLDIRFRLVMKSVRFIFASITVLVLLSIFIGYLTMSRSYWAPQLFAVLPSSFLSSNLNPAYDGTNLKDEVNPDSLNFVKSFAIFFPVVIGFIAGANRSGELKNASRSIPRGTFISSAVAIVVYIVLTLLFASAYAGPLLRTKTPEVGLLYALISWPSYQACLAGIFICGVAQTLQAMQIGPQILQAMVHDEVLPALKYLESNARLKSLLISVLITECVVLIGGLNIVASVATLFYLLCFAFINLACTLLAVLKHPHWRPTFRFYHWSASILGGLISVVFMFLINYIVAISISAALGALYSYVEYTGATIEYGSGLFALNISVAQKRLLTLEKQKPSAVNWRPQILAFVDVKDGRIENSAQMNFLSQLRKAGGLCIVVNCFKKSKLKSSQSTGDRENALRSELQRFKMQGFVRSISTDNVAEARVVAMQSSGLGVLKPNTIVMSYPGRSELYQDYYGVLHCALNNQQAFVLVKSDAKSPFPSNKFEPLSNADTIDVYWITNEGGILTLLPFLLKKHRIWKNCQLRIITVIEANDDQSAITQQLRTLLYKLRINATPLVIQLDSCDMSAFSYEKTLQMQARNKLLHEMRRDSHQLMVYPPANANNNNQRISPYHLNEKKEQSTSEKVITSIDRKKAEYMNTSLKLNKIFKEQSQVAKLLFVSLPAPIEDMPASDYFEYVNILIEGIPRVILVKGSGIEVVTAYL